MRRTRSFLFGSCADLLLVLIVADCGGAKLGDRKKKGRPVGGLIFGSVPGALRAGGHSAESHRSEFPKAAALKTCEDREDFLAPRARR
jgi:hypothetical protein